MEQELRFGLDLGQLAFLKKNIWGDYEQQLFRLVFFQVLLGKKKIIYTYIYTNHGLFKIIGMIKVLIQPLFRGRGRNS